MSTGTPERISTRSFFSTLKIFVLIWIAMIVGGAGLLYWTERNDSVLRHDLNSAKFEVHKLHQSVQQGHPVLLTEVGQLRQQLQTATQRLGGLESTLGTYHGQFEQLADRSSEAQSRQAVERAKVAVVAAQIKTARERLQKLKALLTAWQVQEASLQTGDLGRRVAASPAHCALAIGLLEEERTTPNQVLEWELQLEALANPVEQSARDKDTTFVLTTDHASQLADLGQQLLRAVSQLEHHLTLHTELARETNSYTPTSDTFEALVRKRRGERERQAAERILAARDAARAEAEQEHAERIAQVERQIVEADIVRQEQVAKAKREQQEELTRIEQEKIAAETKVKDAEARAAIAGLDAESVRIDAATQRAQLEKEFERALPQIKSVLTAFLSPGFQNRGQSGGEGPMSYTVIQGSGALVQSSDGRQNLAHLVGNNDRPSGPLRKFRGGMTRDQEATCSRAQELLIKFGPLLVEKELLAP